MIYKGLCIYGVHKNGPILLPTPSTSAKKNNKYVPSNNRIHQHVTNFKTLLQNFKKLFWCGRHKCMVPKVLFISVWTL